METIYVKPDILRNFGTIILQKVGVPRDDAQIVADSMIEANLRGVDSHGISRIKVYVDKIRAGAINPSGEIKILKDFNAIGLISGNDSLGQSTAYKAMNIAIEKARVYGIGAVGVQHTNHIGMASYYTLQAIEHDMIGLVLTNGSPNMPPLGGRQAMLGTNPLALGIPSGKEAPYIMDIATSQASRGKIILAAKQGLPIPSDWAFTKEGLPTTDPNEALKGLVQPMAGHKGYVLSLGLDIMSGVLTGSRYADKIPHMYDFSKNEPQNIGNWIQAVNIEAFIELDLFKERMDDILRVMKNCDREPGCERIYTPGEIEYETRIKRLQQGIPVSKEVADELNNLSKDYNISICIE